MGRKSTSPHVQKLNDIYRHHGPHSPEFCEQIRLFFVYLEYRYLGERHDDLEQRMHERVQDAFAYYDPKKISGVASFIYSVCRHQISSFIYNKKKQMRHSEDGLDRVMDENDHFDEMETQDFLRQSLKQHELITVVPINGSDIVTDVKSGARNEKKPPYMS